MDTSREDLEERYNLLSDEEVSSLYSSGNLTELAQSVAINELKLRRLPLPSYEIKDVKNLEAAYLHENMKVVAENLTSAEASILSGLLQTEGIPADTGNADSFQASSPFQLGFGSASVRVPKEFVMQAMNIINAYNNGNFQLDDDELLVTDEIVDKSLEKAYLAENTANTRKETENQPIKLTAKPIQPVEPTYKTSESSLSGIFLIFILCLLVVAGYQKWFALQELVKHLILKQKSQANAWLLNS